MRAIALSLLIHLLPMRTGKAESHIDFKTLYHIEDSDRMLIVSPILLYENALTPDLTIKIDAVYNSISGATPTGAPPPPLTLTTGGEDAWTISGASPGAVDSAVSGASPGTGSGGGDDDEDEEDDDEHDHDRAAVRRFLIPFSRVSGASPAATTTGRQIPLTEVSDTRTGMNLDISRRFGRHTIGSQLSLSTESDYESSGIALRNGIDFNQRNTTLMLGGGWTHDTVHAVTMPGPEDKDTADLMIGLTQILNPKTTMTVNLTLSRIMGFMDDPYKVVELNGALVPEHRPDTKEKRIAYVSLTRFLDSLNGSLETSYRLYDDSFGVTAHTFTLAWYQRLGRLFVLRPLMRLYLQNEADFYGVSFDGDPAYYSSDYRVSSLVSFGYGLKLVCSPTKRISADLALERYEQRGLDSLTPESVYPSATVITGGMRLWF